MTPFAYGYDGRRELAAVRAVDEDGAPRLGAEVDADRVRAGRHAAPRCGSTTTFRARRSLSAGERLGSVGQRIPLADERAQLDVARLGELDRARKVARPSSGGRARS